MWSPMRASFSLPPSLSLPPVRKLQYQSGGVQSAWPAWTWFSFYRASEWVGQALDRFCGGGAALVGRCVFRLEGPDLQG